jgi:hypothetical protein
MPRKGFRPGEIIAKLREADVLLRQGKKVAEVVKVSFEEIRGKAAGSVQATRRLRAYLEDLLRCAPEERRAPLERQLRLLDAGVDGIDGGDASGPDSAVWRQSDPQGIGASRGAT